MRTLKTWLAGYSLLCAIELSAGLARAQAPALLRVGGGWTQNFCTVYGLRGWGL